jgi:serine/threonine protein kinase
LYAKDAFLCEKVDVWAAGCVWYGILFGTLPFDGQSTVPILQGRIFIPEAPSFPESFVKLLRAMLTVDVSRRADSFTILEAVARLRGAQMDGRLRSIGKELRLRRGSDLAFGSGYLEPHAVALTNTLAKGERPPSNAVSTLKVRDDSGPGVDEDWADFESADSVQQLPSLQQRDEPLPGGRRTLASNWIGSFAGPGLPIHGPQTLARRITGNTTTRECRRLIGDDDPFADVESADPVHQTSLPQQGVALPGGGGEPPSKLQTLARGMIGITTTGENRRELTEDMFADFESSDSVHPSPLPLPGMGLPTGKGDRAPSSSWFDSHASPSKQSPAPGKSRNMIARDDIRESADDLFADLLPDSFKR